MIRTLLVGYGGMGKVHYANTAALESAEIVGIVGTERDREEAEKTGLPFFLTISEGMKALSADVIDITTPTFLHKDHAIEALREKADVIVEKPLALSAEDARKIYQAADKAGKKVYPAYVMRYTKEYDVLSSLVREGRYGNVAEASFWRLSEMPGWVDGSWLFDRDKSGLIPFDLHIHDLDMIISLFGNFSSFDEYSPLSPDGMKHFYSIAYDYGSFRVTAEAGWLRGKIPFSSGWRLIMEHGVAVYDGNRITLYSEDGENDLTPSYSRIVSTGINVPPTGWYYEELREIYAAISEGSDGRVKKEEVFTVLGAAGKL